MAFDDGSGPALYVGGSFDQAGGLPAANIAKWDGTSWSALGSGVTSANWASVQALAVYDDLTGSGPALLVGGKFSDAGGTSAINIAKWDGTSWSALGGGVGAPSSLTWVEALTVFDAGTGPSLFAGGSFNVSSAVPAGNLAQWGCASPQGTPAPWSEDFDDPSVYSPGQDPTQPSTGGWESWDLEPLTGAQIRTTRALSAPHSLFIGGAADTVQRLTATSGKLRLVGHVYVPTAPGPDQLSQVMSLLAFNVFNHNGPKNRSLELAFTPGGTVRFLGGTNNGVSFSGLPNQWAELQLEIDLAGDTCQVYYGPPGSRVARGAPFQWSQGVSGNGAVAVACLDLYANNQTLAPNPGGGVYFDDFQFADLSAFTPFCTAKSTLICGAADISATGTPSATATSGFVVQAEDVRGCRAGLLLYSNQPSVPGVSFGGPGNGLLCVSAPRRAGPIDSGGTSPVFCDGVFSIDMNRFHTLSWSASGCSPAPGQNGPAGFLGSAGTTVHAQMWGRDSPQTGQVLSDGLSWVVGP